MVFSECRIFHASLIEQNCSSFIFSDIAFEFTAIDIYIAESTDCTSVICLVSFESGVFNGYG